MHGKVTSAQAGMAVVLTSIASALVNLPIVQRQAKSKPVIRELAISSFLQVAVGLAVLILQARFIHFS
jgi:formate-dependent nitrite reductase membrane component NrfD